MSTNPRIYLDFNATAPLSPAARSALLEALEAIGVGNPSSIHAEGRAARDRVERARNRVATLVGRPREQLVFTSGGTEANALGVLGLAAIVEQRGGPRVAVTTPIEHPSLRGALAALVARGWELRTLAATPDGAIVVDPAILAGAGLVAFGAVNHELGTIADPSMFGSAQLASTALPSTAMPTSAMPTSAMPTSAAPTSAMPTSERAPTRTPTSTTRSPAAESPTRMARSSAAPMTAAVSTPPGGLAAAARAAGALVHVDAVQAAGKLALEGIDADALAISAHKLGGPAGCGALAIALDEGLPVMDGGHQERGRRAGTENALGIVGFGAAAADPAGWGAVAALGERLERGLIALGARIHGAGIPRVGGTINAAFAGARGESLVIALDLAGVAASTGAACTSGSVQPSPVLLGLGHDPERAREAIRFSLGRTTTGDEIDEVLARLPAIVERARRR